MKQILVVGELNVDLVLSGLESRPALGQEIIAQEFHMVMGSSSAICAAGLARLGAPVDFLGQVGQDDYGQFVIRQLRQLGVGTQWIIRDPTAPTGVTVSLTYPQDRALITFPGSIANLEAAEVTPHILARYHHLHVSSYFLQKKLQPGLPDLFRRARQAGLTVSLDTGWDPQENWNSGVSSVLEEVDIFMPNAREACAIAGEDDHELALRALSQHTRLVVIKCGPEGAVTLEDDQVLHSPGFQVNVVDTTGAGDSFDAGFIYAYVVRGMPLATALRFANACGALSTTGYGGTAAQPTLQQVQDLLG
jgi:sugar/nucleoside kinase (ribokinase family)